MIATTTTNPDGTYQFVSTSSGNPISAVAALACIAELRRAGVNRLEGLCPFHDERTPSFGIDPQGDLVQFLRPAV